MRLALAVVLALAAVAVLAPLAAGKDRVHAVAVEPVRLATPPGEKLRVTWDLVDAEGRPFGASGIYLRVSRCGRRPLRIPARERGHGRYTARFTVPRRGVRKLMVGLEGWRTIRGRTERADARFGFVPALRRDCR